MHKRFPQFLCSVALLTLAACNRPADNSAQIQALNDKIRDLEQREQELQLQNERDKLASDRAALDAERKGLEAQQAPAASAAPASAAALVDPPPAAKAYQSDRDRGDGDRNAVQNGAARNSYDVFYERLQDDGQWFNDDTYGYIWQPKAAAQDPDWRPYTDGH